MFSWKLWRWVLVAAGIYTVGTCIYLLAVVY